jgi:hypothetical protein
MGGEAHSFDSGTKVDKGHALSCIPYHDHIPRFLDDSETDVLSRLPRTAAQQIARVSSPLLTAISRKGISFQLPVIPESGVYSITHDPVHAEMPHQPRRPFAGHRGER